MLQVSHASTTVPRSEFGAEVRHLVQFRVLGLLTLLLAYRTGLRGAERFVPALTVTDFGSPPDTSKFVPPLTLIEAYSL